MQWCLLGKSAPEKEAKNKEEKKKQSHEQNKMKRNTKIMLKQLIWKYAIVAM